MIVWWIFIYSSSITDISFNPYVDISLRKFDYGDKYGHIFVPIMWHSFGNQNRKWISLKEKTCLKVFTKITLTICQRIIVSFLQIVKQLGKSVLLRFESIWKELFHKTIWISWEIRCCLLLRCLKLMRKHVKISSICYHKKKKRSEIFVAIFLCKYKG